jgi:hypothetical protein
MDCIFGFSGLPQEFFLVKSPVHWDTFNYLFWSRKRNLVEHLFAKMYIYLLLQSSFYPPFISHHSHIEIPFPISRESIAACPLELHNGVGRPGSPPVKASYRSYFTSSVSSLLS